MRALKARDTQGKCGKGAPETREYVGHELREVKGYVRNETSQVREHA